MLRKNICTFTQITLLSTETLTYPNILIQFENAGMEVAYSLFVYYFNIFIFLLFIVLSIVIPESKYLKEFSHKMEKCMSIIYQPLTSYCSFKEI